MAVRERVADLLLLRRSWPGPHIGVRIRYRSGTAPVIVSRPALVAATGAMTGHAASGCFGVT